jgi:hypothetical protein
VSNGIDFLGYIVRRDYLLVRRRVVNNLRARLKEYQSLLVKEGRWFRRYSFDEVMLDRLSATLSSYLGHFKMADTYNLCISLWKRFPFLLQYFDFDPAATGLECKYKFPRGLRTTSRQYLYYRWRFKGDVLFFQVGRFFEFYHVRDSGVAHFLGLSEMRKNNRGARYGFPVNLLDRYIQRLLQQKVSITLILERGQYLTGIKERVPAYRFAPSIIYP